MNEKIKLTLEGLEKYKEEYRNRIDVERPRILESIENARAMGDLSENADYTAARDEQGKNEARIKELENILNNYEIIQETKKSKEIKISSKVTYEDLSDNETYVVKIVSSIESDPLSNPDDIKISNVCLLGQALLGKKVGDEVEIKANNPYKVKIIKID